jgi:hypothetical protein
MCSWILVLLPRVGRFLCTKDLFLPLFFPSSHSDVPVLFLLLFSVLRLIFVRIFFLLYPFLVLNSVRFLFAADNSVVLLSSSFLPNVDPLRYSPFLLFPLLARSFAANLIYMCHVCSASSRFNLRAYVHSLRYSKRLDLIFFISFLYLVYYAMCSF